MARTTPLIENNVLTVTDIEAGRTIYSIDISDPKEAKYWTAFLENEKSFRYIHTNKQGFKFTFSGVKEKRKHAYGEMFVWIAHKRIEGKLRRVYLGANRNLTAQKLQETALKICQGTF